jgi:hypothetical protein
MATATKKDKKYVHNVHFNIGSPSNGKDSAYKLIVRLESFNHAPEPPIYGFSGRYFQSGGKRTLRTYDEPHHFNPQNEIPYLEMLFKERYIGCNVFKAQIVDSSYPTKGSIISEWNGKAFVSPETIIRTPPSVKTPLAETFQFRAWLPLKNGQKQLFHQSPIFDMETGEYLEGLTLFALMQQIKTFNTNNPTLCKESGQIYGGAKEYHITDRNTPAFAWFDSIQLTPLYHGRGTNSRPVESYAKLFSTPQN